MSQPEDVQRQLMIITVYIDTSLGECKDLVMFIISGECLTHRLSSDTHQTQHCQVIRERKCFFLYLPCPKSDYHSGDC